MLRDESSGLCAHCGPDPSLALPLLAFGKRISAAIFPRILGFLVPNHLSAKQLPTRVQPIPTGNQRPQTLRQAYSKSVSARSNSMSAASNYVSAPLKSLSAGSKV